MKCEICHLDTIPRHDDASHEREGDDRRSMAMSLATLVDGHCHLGRGNPEAVSEMRIYILFWEMGSDAFQSNLRTFLRHRIEYGLTRAEWGLFKQMISALDDICSEHNLR